MKLTLDHPIGTKMRETAEMLRLFCLGLGLAVTGSIQAALPLPTGSTPAANTADTAATFPKRLTARGSTFGAWDSGFVYPSYGRTGYYANPSVSGTNSTGITGLLEFDSAGNTVRRVSPVQLGVEIVQSNDSTRFFAKQTIGNEVAFGLYSSTSPFAPIFQNRLAGNPAKIQFAPAYAQNRIYAVQDGNTTIDVIAFNTNGTTAWARRYSSSAFGTTLPTDTQIVFAIPLSDGTLLVEVLRFTINLTTFSAGYDTTLIKLSSAGSVEWSKKPTGNAFFVAIPSQSSTNLFLTGAELPASGSTTSPGTLAAKITAAGVPVWAKRISGNAVVSAAGEFATDKVVLVGSTVTLQGANIGAAVAVLGSTGAMESQTQFSFGAVNAPAIQFEGNRIWIGVTAGSTGTEARPAYIGLADATLTNIRWKKYKNNMNVAVVSPDYDSDDVSASFFHNTDHALEVVTFKDDFAASVSTTLFTDATPTVTSPGLVSTDVAFSLSNIAVTDVSFSPIIGSGAVLTFETLTTTETSTGTGGGGGDPLPIPVTIASQPTSQSVSSGAAASLTVGILNPSAVAVTYEWRLNGAAIAGATSATYTIPSVGAANVGFYTAAVTSSGGTLVTTPASLSVVPASRPLGAAVLFAGDIVHPATQNVYDQFLLTGVSATITADPGQIARISFIDLNDDIVQVEFSGAGALTLSLTNSSGPAAPVNYNQAVNYMKGHPTITITGADATTNFGIYSVGAATGNVAVLKQGVVYDGFADIALVNIISPSNQFAGVRIGNASFFAVSGNTGIYAPGVNFAGPLNLYDIDARDNAFPKLVTGTVGATILITGGNLLQTNGRAIEFGNAANVRMNPGTRSDGTFLTAQVNLGKLERNGVDVTASVILGP